MLWACGISGVVGLVLGLRYRVLVVIVLTWAIFLLGIGISLSTGGTLRSGTVAGLVAIVVLHIGYFVSSVARWAWTRKPGLVEKLTLRWRRRHSATP